MNSWPRLLPTLFFVLLVSPVLGVDAQRAVGPGPKVIPMYKVRFDVKDADGNALPASVRVAGVRTKVSFRRTLETGPLTLNLRSGDNYVVEAELDGYQPVRRSIRLDRLGDPTQATLLVTLELKPRQIALPVAVVDDRTGEPITGFWIKAEDDRPNFGTESEFVSQSSDTLMLDPGRAVRVVVKADGYATQTVDVPDTRLAEAVIVRLRPLEDWVIRPYSIRVIDSDLQLVQNKYEVTIRDPFLQPIPLRQDSFSGDWQALLKPKSSYTVEVNASGFVPYRDTLRSLPQSTILVVLHRVVKSDEARKPVAPEPNARPEFYDEWVKQLSGGAKHLASGGGRPRNAAHLTLERLYFSQGSAELDQNWFEKLNRLVELMQEFPALKLKIAGFTDRFGDPRLNLFLADSRAGAVYNYLLDNGADPKRLRFEGYGHSRPAAPSDTEENRQKNRRVEVWVLEK